MYNTYPITPPSTTTPPLQHPSTSDTVSCPAYTEMSLDLVVVKVRTPRLAVQMSDHGGLFHRTESAENDMERGGGMRVSIDDLLKKHEVPLRPPRGSFPRSSRSPPPPQPAPTKKLGRVLVGSPRLAVTEGRFAAESDRRASGCGVGRASDHAVLQGRPWLRRRLPPALRADMGEEGRPEGVRTGAPGVHQVESDPTLAAPPRARPQG